MWASNWLGVVGSVIWGLGLMTAGQAVPPQEPGQLAPAPVVYEEIQIKRQDVTGDGRPDIVTLLGKRHTGACPVRAGLQAGDGQLSICRRVSPS